MNISCRMILMFAAIGIIALGSSCSRPMPSEPSRSGGGATASASAISNTDTPQPTPSIHGARLLGRVLNEAGEPVEGCLIQIEGNTNEYAIVSGADGKFTTRIPWGSQALTFDCGSELYVETRVAIEVPETEEVEQDFTVKSR